MKKLIFIIVMTILGSGYTQEYTHKKTFKDPTGTVSDYFGKAVALNSNFYFVSASLYDYNPKNVPANKNKGKVLVYDRKGNLTQTLPETFIPELKSAHFGYSIAANEDYLVISADKEKGPSNGPSGKVYIYAFNKTTCKWFLEKELVSPLDGRSYVPKNEQFGSSVSIDANNTLLITAESFASKLDPNPTDPHGGSSNEGKGYVYVKKGTEWKREQGELTYYEHNKDIPVASDGFKQRMGQESSAIDGDLIAMGARYYVKEIIKEKKKKVGAVMLFERNSDGKWEKLQRIITEDISSTCVKHWVGCEIGKAVSLEGDLLAFSGTSVDVKTVQKAGKVFIFRKKGKLFELEAEIIEPLENRTKRSYFGSKVILSNGLLYVSSLTGRIGKVYVYRKSEKGWVLKQTLKTPKLEYKFGRSLAVHKDRVMVGSNNDDSKGRAYLYTLGDKLIDSDQIYANGESYTLTKTKQWNTSDESFLANDKFANGIVAKSDNYTFVKSSNPLISYNKETGFIKLEAYIKSTNSYNDYIEYKICRKNICTSVVNCSKIVKTKIKISNSIKATDDDLGAVVKGEKTKLSVFTNDSLSGENQGMIANVNFELIDKPKGISITSNGTIQTNNNSLVGSYKIKYRICEKNLSSFSNCSNIAYLKIKINCNKTLKPVLNCLQVAVFNEDTCKWVITSKPKPEKPTLTCLQTALFNLKTCNWDITTKPKPKKPVTECYETTKFDVVTCKWVISGNKITPIFNQIQPICKGYNFELPIKSKNDIKGTWRPAINNNETTEYTFTPIDSCITSVKMTVTVTNVSCSKASEFVIFNKLTPNNDGKNDCLYIKDLENYKNNHIQIFNRWGGLVYDKEMYKNDDWCGGSKTNNTLAAGTYFYLFSFENNKGKRIHHKGWIYLSN